MPTIALLDASYGSGDGSGEAPSTTAACVIAADWRAAAPLRVRVERVPGAAAYEPGAFYQRELPALLAVLRGEEPLPDVVVVDGYVYLDADGRPGLGAHLHAAIGRPVVGVAKTAFAGSRHAVPVLRGTSAKPLYVTAVGVDPDRAAAEVAAMHGAHRVPTLIRLADQASRGG